MISGSAWRIGLTVLFVAAAVSYAVAGNGSAGWRCKGAWALHAVAAAAMAAMLWPIGMAVSPLVYLVFFTGCGLYIVFIGVFFGSLTYWPYHAAMMAAMAAMPLLMTAPTVAMPAMSHHGDQMAMSMAMAPSVGVAAANPGWSAAASATLAGLFLLAALWWFYIAVRGPQRPYPDLLMALGMAVSFALCI